jgi:DNA adenine methylase
VANRLARAGRRASDDDAARPFVKWAGGKRQLLPALVERVPARFATYHEPFLGGGALFFALRPAVAHLSDNNERLVRAYGGVRDDVERVIELLQSYPHDERFYYRMRAVDVDRKSDAEVAAWLIYLNRTGFNGLYRVNSRNAFNVPFGDYARPKICDADNLRRCARALRGAHLACGSFERVLDHARVGDFVYFDPPYVPASSTSYFTSYTREGFGPREQEKLRDVARALKERSVHVLLSNSAVRAVRRLYRDGFELKVVRATRGINARADRRGPVPELLIR